MFELNEGESLLLDFVNIDDSPLVCAGSSESVMNGGTDDVIAESWVWLEGGGLRLDRLWVIRLLGSTSICRLNKKSVQFECMNIIKEEKDYK